MNKHVARGKFEACFGRRVAVGIGDADETCFGHDCQYETRQFPRLGVELIVEYACLDACGRWSARVSSGLCLEICRAQ